MLLPLTSASSAVRWAANSWALLEGSGWADLDHLQGPPPRVARRSELFTVYCQPGGPPPLLSLLLSW